LTVLQKVGIRTFSSFRRKPESREFKQLQFPWAPVFTGVTTFCRTVKIGRGSIVHVALASLGDGLGHVLGGGVARRGALHRRNNVSMLEVRSDRIP